MRSLAIVLGCATAGAGLGAVDAFVLPSRYHASAAVTVRDGAWEFGPTGTAWCEEHLFGGVMIEAVTARTGADFDSEAVFRAIRAARDATTTTLTIEWPDPLKAADFANAWAEWVRERALEEIANRRPIEPGEVEITRRAEPPESPVAPLPWPNAVVGFALGALAGTALALGQSPRNAASSGARSSAC